jgi:hypothetical protein
VLKLWPSLQLSTARFRISEASHIAAASEADMQNNEKAMTTRLETLKKQQAEYEKSTGSRR